jgi:glycerophosphoryl diester phosphodiesterase
MSIAFLKGCDRPLLFAHRGRSAKAPENTMAAFSLAWESGIPGVELDVRLCATGELVVFHDSDLIRITTVEGTVERSTLTQLQALDAGGWFSDEFKEQRIPTLAEVFGAAPSGTYFDIEIKVTDGNSRSIAKELSRIVERFSMAARCIISSFYPSAILTAKRFCRGVPTSLIYSTSLKEEHPIQHLAARGLSNAPILKPQWQTALKTLEHRGGAGKPIIPWTINEASIAERCLELGAEGIISDDPIAVIQ